MADTRPAAFEQQVNLTVRVLVQGTVDDFSVDRDKMRLAIEQAVQRFIPAVLLDGTIDITATNLAGAGRGYIHPEQAASYPTTSALVLPFDTVVKP